MDVRPTTHSNPSFANWIERRRQRMQAQLSAIHDERFGDLAKLIDDEHLDPPPPPKSRDEREEYRQMLLESEELSRRLAEIRSKLMTELRGIERERVRGGFNEGRGGGLGSSLDGYL